MDSPRGRVLSLHGSGETLRAVVAVREALVCPRCAEGKGCGAGLFTNGNRPRQVEAAVAPQLRPQVDDQVELHLGPDRLLQAALLVYGLPLFGAIAGSLLAFVLALGDWDAALLALAGLGSGLLLSRWRVQRSSCARRFAPRIERIV